MKEKVFTELRGLGVSKEHALVGTILLVALTLWSTSLRFLIVQGLIDVAQVFLHVIPS
jgi:hypothetical protein